MSKTATRQLITLSILVAVEIVLNRFLSINAWNIKIGFSFVPVVIAAILFGPLQAAVVGALGDFLGAILFPIGPYFPGFTLTAFLTGLVFGVFLHKEQTLSRILGAVVIAQFVLGLFLNTYWISVLYGSPFGPLLATRVIQAALLTVVQTVTTLAIARVMPRIRKAVVWLEP